MENLNLKKLALAGSLLGVSGLLAYTAYRKYCPCAQFQSSKDQPEEADDDLIDHVVENHNRPSEVDVELDQPLVDSSSEEELQKEEDENSEQKD